MHEKKLCQFFDPQLWLWTREMSWEESAKMKNAATVGMGGLLPTVSLQAMEEAQTVAQLQGAVSFPHY